MLRKSAVVGSASLLAILLVIPMSAQEARWKELNAQVLQFLRQGEYAKGVPVAQEALRVAEATFGPEDPKFATALNNLAALFEAQGKYAEAEPLYKRSLAIREKALEPDHPDVAQSLENYAALLLKMNRGAEAEKMEARAKTIRAKHAQTNPKN